MTDLDLDKLEALAKAWIETPLEDLDAYKQAERRYYEYLDANGVRALIAALREAQGEIERLTTDNDNLHAVVQSRGNQLAEAEAKLARLVAALNDHDLFINPEALEEAAVEIDCCPGDIRGCESSWCEWDTGASGCHKFEAGEYCPFSVAETLRAVAKIARDEQSTDKDKP